MAFVSAFEKFRGFDNEMVTGPPKYRGKSDISKSLRVTFLLHDRRTDGEARSTPAPARTRSESVGQMAARTAIATGS